MRYPNKITDCEYFEPKTLTVFDHITESVEMLAEEIVYPYKIRFAYGSEDNWQEYWTSPLIENFYPTRNEAIATTIEELKKEWNTGKDTDIPANDADNNKSVVLEMSTKEATMK
jgi:hypothetical protein